MNTETTEESGREYQRHNGRCCPVLPRDWHRHLEGVRPVNAPIATTVPYIIHEESEEISAVSALLGYADTDQKLRDVREKIAAFPELEAVWGAFQVEPGDDMVISLMEFWEQSDPEFETLSPELVDLLVQYDDLYRIACATWEMRSLEGWVC